MVSSFGDLLKCLRKQKGLSQHQLAEHLGVHPNTISGWECGNNLPNSKGIVLELAHQLHLNKQETRQLLNASLTTPLPYWSLPYQRNPFFTGRENIFPLLHDALKQEHAALNRSYTLSGLGGIGKTQTAVEYAYRYADDYIAVFWVSAETAESILVSLIAMGNQLNLLTGQRQEQSRIMIVVTHWLSSHSDWLLIFDNVENIELIKDILPAARHGSLLFTSRKQALGITAQTLNMKSMTSEEGRHFLLRRAGWLGAQSTLDQLSPADLVCADEIVAAMDGLPLALDQAGAYIEATKCNLSDYLQLFKFSQLSLLDEREIAAEHPISVAKTFALAFEQIKQSSVPAAELLTACAYLSAEAIPETFFIEGAADLGPIFESLAADFLHFNAAIRILLSHSLLQRNAVTHTLTIHRLVQVVLKGNLPEVERRQWVERLLRAMVRLFPAKKTQIDYYQICERLLPHALICLTLNYQWEEGEILRATLMNYVAIYLVNRAYFAEARSLYEQALHLCESAVDPEHPLIAKTLHGLATLFWEQGKYEQAEPLFKRSLGIWEQAGDQEKLWVGSPINGLGILYAQQGRYEQAEPLFRRSLGIWEQTLGPEHPQVGTALTNLANLFWEQEKYEQAEPLFKRSLGIWEQALGPEHPQVAHPLQGLAELYTKQGKYEQAELLFQRVLHIREQTLGVEHPQVAHPLQGLAELYTKQGKYEQAELLFQRALHIREQTLGLEHTTVAETLYSLAQLYQILQQPDKALSLYQRALTIFERAFGAYHKKTSETYLAYTQLRQSFDHVINGQSY